MDGKNAYKTFTITKIRADNYRVRTYYLDGAMDCLPGQFCMLWLPRLNEKPFSIMDGAPLTLNIAAVGEFTKKVAELKEGDKVTVRGPYGTAFKLGGSEKTVLLVGGGYGVAPLFYFAKSCLKRGVKPVMVIGARTKDDVILEDDFRQAGIETIVTTNDGTAGITGMATVGTSKAFAEHKIDAAFTCGPERMMAAIAKQCTTANIPLQLSFERYMGCGMGICGKCVAGGIRACTDGPVITAELAATIPDFAASKRDPSGQKTPM